MFLKTLIDVQMLNINAKNKSSFNKGLRLIYIPSLPLGRVFHAMVSVMAVKIQFSSPSMVLLSFN